MWLSTSSLTKTCQFTSAYLPGFSSTGWWSFGSCCIGSCWGCRHWSHLTLMSWWIHKQHQQQHGSLYTSHLITHMNVHVLTNGIERSAKKSWHSSPPAACRIRWLVGLGLTLAVPERERTLTHSHLLHFGWVGLTWIHESKTGVCLASPHDAESDRRWLFDIQRYRIGKNNQMELTKSDQCMRVNFWWETKEKKWFYCWVWIPFADLLNYKFCWGLRRFLKTTFWHNFTSKICMMMARPE